jgi:ABC-2 type transport system ATP-binding protein
MWSTKLQENTVGLISCKHTSFEKVETIIERPSYMTAEQNLKLVCKIKNISYTKFRKKLELVGLNERKTVSSALFL